jgi:ADP-ribosylglycohydrolase
MRGDLKSRVRGCVLGAALGDAVGGPFEFGSAERAPAQMGQPWIDGLYPYEIAPSPHGVWGAQPAAGTGTDDTRYNWLFLELAVELGRMPTGRDLAGRFLEIYQGPEALFPGHAALARKQFAHWEGVCRGYLGQTSELYPGLPPDVLLARSLGLNFPILSGLITLTSAGLLFPGRPEDAYQAAFRAAFYDIGYAREAVALLAAAISMALAGDGDPQVLFDRVVALDPLHLGGEFSAPFVKEHLASFSSVVGDSRVADNGVAANGAGSKADQEVARALSAAFRSFHPFDPFRTLGVAFLSVLAAGGDALRSILVAANHVGLDERGSPTRYEDIDCYAGIAGAWAGAIGGAEALPAAMVGQVVRSNKAIYGFDLETTVERFVDRFLQGG